MKNGVLKIFAMFTGKHLFRSLFYNIFAVLRPATLLRILTGKNYRQNKLQRLQKVQIWAFGLLVHQINSL